MPSSSAVGPAARRLVSAIEPSGKLLSPESQTLKASTQREQDLTPQITDLLFLALTRYGVGWFVRGQLGSKDEVTAELSGDHLNTLKLELSCDEKRPYLSRWLHHDWNETDAQKTMIEWLIDEKEKVMNAFNHLGLKR